MIRRKQVEIEPSQLYEAFSSLLWKQQQPYIVAWYWKDAFDCCQLFPKDIDVDLYHQFVDTGVFNLKMIIF